MLKEYEDRFSELLDEYHALPKGSFAEQQKKQQISDYVDRVANKIAARQYNIATRAIKKGVNSKFVINPQKGNPRDPK